MYIASLKLPNTALHPVPVTVIESGDLPQTIRKSIVVTKNFDGVDQYPIMRKGGQVILCTEHSIDTQISAIYN